MESTFTFQPSYPDSETSWRDNANWKEAPREHSNPELTLPHRNVKKRFEHVPDFGDAEFDKKNPERMYRHFFKQRPSLGPPPSTFLLLVPNKMHC